MFCSLNRPFVEDPTGNSPCVNPIDLSLQSLNGSTFFSWTFLSFHRTFWNSKEGSKTEMNLINHNEIQNFKFWFRISNENLFIIIFGWNFQLENYLEHLDQTENSCFTTRRITLELGFQTSLALFPNGLHLMEGSWIKSSPKVWNPNKN